MVKPLTIMKMLHCRNLNTKSSEEEQQKQAPVSKRKTRRITTIKSISMDEDINNSNEVVKSETNSELCRVCLKQGALPIYGNDPNVDLAAAVSSFAAIEISIYDPYPKYLCHPCNTLLQGAILFRKTAQESEELLKKPLESEFDMDDHFSDSAIDKSDEPSTSTEQRFSLTCKQCEIEFDTFEQYNDHRLSSEHENKKKLCPICNKSYAPNYFKIHMEIHKGKTSYVCDVCGKNFTLQYQFKRHRLTHFYSLPFKCSLCPYRGRFSESLKMHMRSHTGEKPYICEECPQRFISKSNLNKHMLTHKKEHDFRCECGRGFYTKRELGLHFKVEHTGIKEHVCKICGKAFGYRKQLMKHERKVHNREKLKTGRMPIYLKLETMNHIVNNTPLLT